jgi:polar amino acid transport system substrate-binding protein
MSFFKRLTAGALVLAATVAVAGTTPALAQKKWTEIKIGTEGAYPPFNNLNAQGKLEGFEIDYANMLCEKMKVKCTWVAQDWDGIIPALLAKKYDVIIAGMNATEERKKRVDFSIVYTKIPISMMSAKSVTNADIKPDALKGKTIGTQGSTIHSNYLEKYYKGSTLKFYPTQEEANLDLANGRLDYVVADYAALAEFVDNKGKDCCKILAEVPRDPVIHGPGVGMAFRKEDSALRDMWNKAIAESMKDGSFKKINDKWFKYDTCPACGAGS